MADYILVLDEGTTSTRAMLFASDGVLVANEMAPRVQRDAFFRRQIDHDHFHPVDRGLPAQRVHHALRPLPPRSTSAATS